MDQGTLFRALGALGVHPQALEHLRRIPFQAAVESLKKLQEDVKPRYKKLALELHPDCTGDDAAKSQLFVEVTTAHKWLQDLRVQPPPPQPTFQVQRMVFYPAAHPFGGSVRATSTSTSTSYNAARVVFIKVT